MGEKLKRRTAEREVDGLIFDMKPDGTIKMRRHKIVFRITKDELGKSISLCDELRGIMIEIPLEPVEDLYDRGQYEKGYKAGRWARDAEIVRCQECISKECMGRGGQIVCGITGEQHAPDWFCKDGEREEEEDEQ